MARPRNTVRTVEVHLMLPMDLVGRIELLLFSEVQGRVPLGRKAQFFERAARELLARIEEQYHA